VSDFNAQTTSNGIGRRSTYPRMFFQAGQLFFKEPLTPLRHVGALTHHSLDQVAKRSGRMCAFGSHDFDLSVRYDQREAAPTNEEE
jgi:hypothetical protein